MLCLSVWVSEWGREREGGRNRWTDRQTEGGREGGRVLLPSAHWGRVPLPSAHWKNLVFSGENPVPPGKLKSEKYCFWNQTEQMQLSSWSHPRTWYHCRWLGRYGKKDRNFPLVRAGISCTRLRRLELLPYKLHIRLEFETLLWKTPGIGFPCQWLHLLLPEEFFLQIWVGNPVSLQVPLVLRMWRANIHETSPFRQNLQNRAFFKVHPATQQKPSAIQRVAIASSSVSPSSCSTGNTEHYHGIMEHSLWRVPMYWERIRDQGVMPMLDKGLSCVVVDMLSTLHDTVRSKPRPGCIYVPILKWDNLLHEPCYAKNSPSHHPLLWVLASGAALMSPISAGSPPYDSASVFIFATVCSSILENRHYCPEPYVHSRPI